MPRPNELVLNPFIGGVTLTKDEWETIKRLLKHSWADLNGQYSNLTKDEQELISPEMFRHLMKQVAP